MNKHNEATRLESIAWREMVQTQCRMANADYFVQPVGLEWSK